MLKLPATRSRSAPSPARARPASLATAVPRSTRGCSIQEGTSPPGTPAREAALTYFGALLEEPDGSILYTGLEGRVMRIRASDGRLEHVAGGEPGGVVFNIPYGIVRLPGGDLVVADAGNGRLVRIAAATGRAAPIELLPVD